MGVAVPSWQSMVSLCGCGCTFMAEHGKPLWVWLYLHGIASMVRFCGCGCNAVGDCQRNVLILNTSTGRGFNFSYKMDGLLWKVVVKNKPFTCKFDTSMNHTRVWCLAASVCVCFDAIPEHILTTINFGC